MRSADCSDERTPAALKIPNTNLIWGEAEPEWLDQNEANRICVAVRARYDQAAWQLAHEKSHAPAR